MAEPDPGHQGPEVPSGVRVGPFVAGERITLTDNKGRRHSVVLAPGGTYTCNINRVLTEEPGTTHTNVATVTGADDETLDNLARPVEEQNATQVPVTDSDDADVLTLAPDTSVTKEIDGEATLDPETGVLRAGANPRGMQGYAVGR